MMWLLLGIALVMLLTGNSRAEPLRLHPDNPHYFLFQGKPTVIIGSGEHYGAVLNLDFDYAKYVDALGREGMNHTRMFVGAYCEAPGNFGITRNTLAPEEGRFVCPWARSDQPGYANGGSKFDLARFDDAYFARLRDFVARAGERGVIVEVNLFCPFYDDSMWALSPMNAVNNVNGVGQVAKEEAYTAEGRGGLLAVQEAMTRKVVQELNESDNVYFEVMNEPYTRDMPMAWQERIAQVIAETEAGLPNRHLISLNIANRKAEVKEVYPAVSVLNFHYAWPPETVGMNYGLNLPIGDNETGFATTTDFPYRREAWAFILAGGALFSHLDYSFAVGFEDGTFQYPATQPGGGNATLRRQFRTLAEFMAGLDFVHMAPAKQVIRGALPEGVVAEALAEAGKQYAVYLCRMEAAEPAPVELTLELPAGRYGVEWLDPVSGEVKAREDLEHAGGEGKLPSPAFGEDVALKVVARG